VTPIFPPIHQGHFRLFAADSGPFYAELVEHLESTLFAMTADVVRKKTVQSAIEEFLIGRAWKQSFRGEEEDAPGAPIQQTIYSRLVDCGWLLEVRDGLRLIVDFDSNARLLLHALIDIREGRLRNFGGEVLQVYTLLTSAISEPDLKSQNALAAGRLARNFMANLRGITGGLRKIEQEVRSQPSPREMMAVFFEHYDGDKLVADFKKLRSANNPYRFRHDLIEQADRLAANEILLEKLAAGIVREGYAGDAEHAVELLQTELTTIVEVFRSVDTHVEMIEQTNRRIERRVRNIALFLNRMGTDETGVMIEAARKLAATNIGYEQSIPLTPPYIDALPPLDAASLFRARAKPRKTGKVRVRKRERDLAEILSDEAREAYAARIHVTAERARDFMSRILGEKTRVRASNIEIETLDDFFVFERLPHLPERIRTDLSEFEIVPIDGARFESDWIAMAEFEIRRTDAEVLEG
jgi:hypothetical protein